MGQVKILVLFCLIFIYFECSKALENVYFYGDIECLFRTFKFFKSNLMLNFNSLDGKKIYEATSSSLAFNKRKSKWTNSVTIKIAERGNEGNVVMFLNPDPDNIHHFNFTGKPELLFVEIHRSDTRVRFNSLPSDGFSDYEFAVEPFDLDIYNVTVMIFQLNP